MTRKNTPTEQIFNLSEHNVFITFNPYSESTQKHIDAIINGVNINGINSGICAEIVTKYVKYNVFNPFRTASGIIDLKDENIEIKSSEFQIAEQYKDCKSLTAYLKRYYHDTPRTAFDIALFNSDYTALHVWHFSKTQFVAFGKNYGKHKKGAIRFDGKKARGRKLTLKGMREYISRYYAD